MRLSAPTLRQFADLHGYDLHIGDCSEAEGRPPAWAKVKMLANYLESYESCLWVDSDAMIIRFGSDIAEAVPLTSYQALAPHPQTWIGAPNTGVWFVRSCERSLDFLTAVWESTDLIHHSWWEQAAVAHLLGYGIGGMNGLGDDVSMAPMESMWSDGFVWLDSQWNALYLAPHFPGRDEVIRHHTGTFMSKRLAWMRVDAAYAQGRIVESLARYMGTRAYYGARGQIHNGRLRMLSWKD
jgi:hypothetical protein